MCLNLQKNGLKLSFKYLSLLTSQTVRCHGVLDCNTVRILRLRVRDPSYLDARVQITKSLE